jgi:hypothetical protein
MIFMCRNLEEYYDIRDYYYYYYYYYYMFNFFLGATAPSWSVPPHSRGF